MLRNIVYIFVAIFGFYNQIGKITAPEATQLSKNGYTYERLNDDPVVKKIQDTCKNNMLPPEIRILPSGFVVPERVLDILPRIKKLDVRLDDTWLISYPKSGNIWIMEMVWLLKNQFNFEGAKSAELFTRFLFLEFTGLSPLEYKDADDSIGDVINHSSPRFIKTHLLPQFLPEQMFTVNPKIIYMIRNPKDTAVSYAHHFEIWNNFSGSYNDFYEAFIEDKMIFSPYWEHVLTYWKLRDRENVLVVEYEDMKTDLAKVMKKVADFLNVSYSKETEMKLLDHLQYEKMKDNESVNFADDLRLMGKGNEKSLRKGKVGNWVDEMSPEMIAKMDDWTREKLKGSDFPYQYYENDYYKREEENEGKETGEKIRPAN